MKEDSKRGGKREGSGRKKVEDKKQQLQVYIEGSKIEALGGEDATKEFIYDAVDKESKKKKRKPIKPIDEQRR